MSRFIAPLIACLLVLILSSWTNGDDPPSLELREKWLSKYSYSEERKEDLIHLLSTFKTEPLNIIALENALGDLDQDSLVNILDLLRMRDIVEGLGEPASNYELKEGDLNVDSDLNSDDIDFLHNVLIYKQGLPHEIGNDGGLIASNDGTTFITIPENFYDGPKHLCIEKYGEDDLERDLKTDVGDLGNEFQFLAGSNLVLLNPEDGDEIPSQDLIVQELAPDSMMVDGANSLIALNNDIDGDGIPDPVLIGELKEEESGSTSSKVQEIAKAKNLNIVTYRKPRPPKLDQVNPVLIDLQSGDEEIISTNNAVEPGTYLGLYGTNWNSKFMFAYEVRWVIGDDTLAISPVIALNKTRSQKAKTRGLGVLVPTLPEGDYEILVYDEVSGLESNSLNITISALQSEVVPGVRDSLLNLYAAINEEMAALLMEQSEMRNQFPQTVQQIEQSLVKFESVIDSLSNLSISELDIKVLEQEYRFLKNARLFEYFRDISSNKYHPSDAEEDLCILGCERKYIEVVLSTACAGAGLFASSVGTPLLGWGVGSLCLIITQIAWERYTSIVELNCKINCCMQAADTARNKAERSNSSRNSRVDLRNICVHYRCETFLLQKERQTLLSGKNLNEIDPNPGTIIKVNNSPIAVSQGVMNANGLVAIPFNVLSGNITFSAYDPVTGYFDDNIASVFVEDPFKDKKLLGISFQPNTEVIQVPLPFSSAVKDTVSVSAPRYEFLVPVSGADLEKELGFAFSAENPLTLWIQDPDDNFIYKEAESTCLVEKNLEFNSDGIYKVTVTFGMEGQQGAFELGVSDKFSFPTNSLCGNVWGDLSSANTYLVKENTAVESGDSLHISNDTRIVFSAGTSLVNRGSISISQIEESTFTNGEIVNYGKFYSYGNTIEIGGNSSLVMGDARGVIGVEGIDKLTILNTGRLSNTPRLVVPLVLKELHIESGGIYDVIGKGYRGTGQEGWNGGDGSVSESFPGLSGAIFAGGGSHGGFGGIGENVNGKPGEVYGSIEDPSTFGAGGSHTGVSEGKNGGGVVLVEADKLIVDGVIAANGSNQTKNRGTGGAGGSVNIRVREISGSGTIHANGGNSGHHAGGAGGGRVAIRWEEGSINDLTVQARGGNISDTNFNEGEPGGAGTIFLKGPQYGERGQLIVSNNGIDGDTTPIRGNEGQFNSLQVLGGANLMIDSLLVISDSVYVSGTNTDLELKENAILSSPYLLTANSGRVTFGENLDLDLEEIRALSNSFIRSMTDLTFRDATKFQIAGGAFENRSQARFTIERFEPDHISSGVFRNYGTLMIESDSLIVGQDVIFEENGLLNDDDHISLMRVQGQVAHTDRWVTLLYSQQPDSGLAFVVEDLLHLEEGGVINASGRGYRGTNRDRWKILVDGALSETLPGVTGASFAAGGSHGGVGGKGQHVSGSPGEVYGSTENPRAFGAGGSHTGSSSGQNGGGLINIEAGRFIIDGIITANGRRQTNNLGAGGAGGSINLRVGEISGSGEIRANGGDSGFNAGGAGGGRIAIRWDNGSIDGLELKTLGGKISNDNFNGGKPGQPGTIHLVAPGGVIVPVSNGRKEAQ